MYLRKHTINVVATSSKGDIEHTGVVNGLVHSINYTSSTGTGLSSTANIEFKSEKTGISILSISVGSAGWNKYPRNRTVVTATGGVINPTSSGSSISLTEAKVAVVEERIKATLSNSTAASQAGTFYVFTEGY